MDQVLRETLVHATWGSLVLRVYTREIPRALVESTMLNAVRLTLGLASEEERDAALRGEFVRLVRELVPGLDPITQEPVAGEVVFHVVQPHFLEYDALLKIKRDKRPTIKFSTDARVRAKNGRVQLSFAETNDVVFQSTCKSLREEREPLSQKRPDLTKSGLPLQLQDQAISTIQKIVVAFPSAGFTAEFMERTKTLKFVSRLERGAVVPFEDLRTFHTVVKAQRVWLDVTPEGDLMVGCVVPMDEVQLAQQQRKRAREEQQQQPQKRGQFIP